MTTKDPKIAMALGRVGQSLGRMGWSLYGKTLLIAWSGGPDSSALVGLMRLRSRTEKTRLVLGHVNHGLRPESVDEERMVREAAAKWGIPLKCATLDLDKGPGLAERARDARRELLLQWARETGSDAVLLGHTATDQAETMLMNLSRGSGLRGVRGIRPVTKVEEMPWVRPLLDLTREETRELAKLLDIPFADDPTNVCEKHLRVRVRTRVLPELRKRNPYAERSFAAAARDLQEVEDALEVWVTREWDKRFAENQISLDGVEELPKAIRTRLVLRLLQRVMISTGNGGVRKVVEEVAQGLMEKGRPRRWDIPGGALILIPGRCLRISL